MSTSPSPHLAAAALVVALAAVPGIVRSQTPLAPQRFVADVSQSEWSQRWWQWAASFERADSPVADRTGANCANGQGGPVWFLAGTYGSQRVIRECTVPPGKFLFFPLINYIVMPRTAAAASDTGRCADMQLTAQEITDDPSVLVLEIDGRQVQNLEIHRQASPGCFDAAANAKSSTRLFPSASNGYYVMIEPLPRGTHVLNFGGVLESLAQAVTYTLTVQ